MKWLESVRPRIPARWTVEGRFAVSILVLITLMMLIPESGAVSQKVSVAQEGWTWQAQSGPTPPLGPASGIGENQLPVSWEVLAPDKISYIRFDLSDIMKEPSLSFATFRLRMPIDPAGNNLNLSEAKIVACLVLEPWAPGAPMNWDTRPETDCDRASSGSYDATADEFRFDLTLLAEEWIGPYNYGVALEPAPDSPPLFQAVFKGTNAGGVLTEAEVQPSNPTFTGSTPQNAPDDPSLAVPPYLPPIGGALLAPGVPTPNVSVKPVAPSGQPNESRVPTFRWAYLLLVVLAVLRLIGSAIGKPVLYMPTR